MAGNLTKLLRDPGARRRVYHLAAAAVWGIILALALGVIEFDGQTGQFLLRDNWFLATVGLSAIMYVALALLKKMLPAYQTAKEKQTTADE